MRTVTAGIAGTVAAVVLGVCATQGAALAQGAPSTPSAGDAGIAAGKSLMDLLNAFRSGGDGSSVSNSSTPGASY